MNDADLIPSPEPANLERLAAALRSLGARVLNPGEQDVLHVRLGDIDVPVVGLDDLIRMKLARGRPVDLADVASLTDPDAGGEP